MSCISVWSRGALNLSLRRRATRWWETLHLSLRRRATRWWGIIPALAHLLPNATYCTRGRKEASTDNDKLFITVIKNIELTVPTKIDFWVGNLQEVSQCNQQGMGNSICIALCDLRGRTASAREGERERERERKRKRS